MRPGPESVRKQVSVAALTSARTSVEIACSMLEGEIDAVRPIDAALSNELDSAAGLLGDIIKKIDAKIAANTGA